MYDKLIKNMRNRMETALTLSSSCIPQEREETKIMVIITIIASSVY